MEKILQKPVTQAVILAGGYGTRISEETHLKPKPMVTVGGRPVLWHIMKCYSHYGINDFIICLGYKGYIIKEYFNHYNLHMSDITIDLSKDELTIHQCEVEPWKVTLVNTGEDTMTGGRIKRISPYLHDTHFCLTYGDGLSDVNINALIEFHLQHKKLGTITAVQPPSRFGAIELLNEQVTLFKEKPSGTQAWINGGFFVLSKDILEYIEGDNTIWERGPLEQLALREELMAYKHEGFWAPMDMLRDKQRLEKYWTSGNAPWKIWR